MKNAFLCSFAVSPSMRREWIEMTMNPHQILLHILSPSMRREWIEIELKAVSHSTHRVSLHAEGVD